MSDSPENHAFPVEDSQHWRTRAQAKLNQKTKPVGALGQLERIALDICAIQKTEAPTVDPARILVFAGDHGVAADAVSLYPKAVTAQMMANFAAGGAAINVLARAFALQLELIDVGVDADLRSIDGVTDQKIAHGCGNIRVEPAMSASELVRAMAVGAQAALRAHQAGCKSIVLGEMGIANTTAAAALLCALGVGHARELVGAGTGVTGDKLQHKIAVVEAAVARHQMAYPQSKAKPAERAGAREILADLGGFEIAALVGAMIEAASLQLVVLVDGFIATAAAHLAARIHPAARAHMIFAHEGAERGHKLALSAIGAEPILHLSLRLGEASGAALAFPLLRAACAIVNEMASFTEAGVSTAER
jgi:nicotinate-nucleotide--dimethylbenzimidazole phosphoribosyltransferase